MPSFFIRGKNKNKTTKQKTQPLDSAGEEEAIFFLPKTVTFQFVLHKTDQSSKGSLAVKTLKVLFGFI